MNRMPLRKLSKIGSIALSMLLVVVIAPTLDVSVRGQDATSDFQACCLADGSCVDTDVETCGAHGGTPQGEGTSCSDVACPQPTQACCLPSGACEDLQADTCVDVGGTPQGDGTSCDAMPSGCPRPTEACCFDDGSCEDLEPDACSERGGSAQGTGTSCWNTDCPQPMQACCFDDGSCEDLEPDACSDQGGTAQGTGSRCWYTDCPRPTEACCFDDGRCEDLEDSRCAALGGTSQGEDTDCRHAECPQLAAAEARPLTIDLLSPRAGEESSGMYCWESLGIPGLMYEVILHTKTCDPDVVNGPHPFAPLIPDPEPGKRASALRREKRALEVHLSHLSKYCENVGKMFEQLRNARNEIPNRLRQLEKGRDEADAAQADTEEQPFVLPLPETCPRSAEELLAPHAALLDALQIEPCQEDPCRGLNDQLRAIVGLIQSLQAHAFVQSLRFEALLRRWVNGADHRGTMALYHELFSLVDAAIALVDEIVGLLTPDIESLIESLIEEQLTDTACRLSPEVCDAVAKAQTARDKLDTIRGILESARATGTPGPAFLVEMVQAMVQQAAAATAVAVEGWANFAEAMGARLWDAYESTLCLDAVLEWLLAREDRIQAMCEACRRCVQDHIAAIDDELEEIAARQAAAAEARTAYWEGQTALISSQIDRLDDYLEEGWLDACCADGSQTLKIPSEGACAEQIEEGLKRALGDKACFLEFECTIECKTEGGEIVGADVECSFESPLAERRPCCCVPCERQQTSLGGEPDPGRPGETVCHPVEPEPSGAEPAGWSVEGRDADGNLIASSPRRASGPGAITQPGRLTPVPVSPGGCRCTVGASMAGVPILPGVAAIAWRPGDPAMLAVVGDCGPGCSAGTQSITIQPPMPSPLWLAAPIALAPLPVSIAASSTRYDFPIEGLYTVTVTQVCEDGQQCSTSFNVDAQEPPGPVLRLSDADLDRPGTMPACGHDECLELAVVLGDEPPAMPVFDHRLTLIAPADVDLELSSACRVDCTRPRTVRWEMTRPDGTLEVFEGEDRYRIRYAFDDVGTYSLCAIETVACPEGVRRFENWWLFLATTATPTP